MQKGDDRLLLYENRCAKTCCNNLLHDVMYLHDIRLSVCLSVCVFVCLFQFHVTTTDRIFMYFILPQTYFRQGSQYLSDQLQYVADLPTRRRGRLRSSTSNLLDVRPSRCVTVGDRLFGTASPRLWNSLPADVRSASSLTTFRRKLKTHLFQQSYPDVVL